MVAEYNPRKQQTEITTLADEPRHFGQTDEQQGSSRPQREGKPQHQEPELTAHTSKRVAMQRRRTLANEDEPQVSKYQEFPINSSERRLHILDTRGNRGNSRKVKVLLGLSSKGRLILTASHYRTLIRRWSEMEAPEISVSSRVRKELTGPVTRKDVGDVK